MRPGRRVRILSVCAFTGISLLLGEILLRITLPSHYYIWPPHLHTVFKPDEAALPGVSGSSEFVTNSRGIRGDELLPQHTYRILAIGGSTTECLYLDQHKAWPYLLQQSLNDVDSGRRIWVGNVGMSGRTTRHHLTAMQFLPLGELKIDVAILLMGINDFARRLAQDSQYDADFLDRPGSGKTLLYETFSGGNQPYPDDGVFFKRTATWRLLKQVDGWISRNKVEDQAGRVYVTWREHRRSASAVRTRLPDLTSALLEYRRNTERIIDVAQQRSVRLILVTQPTMWRADLPDSLRSLLWFGGVGDFQRDRGHPYYSVEALEQGMKEYNDMLLDVCRERHVECLDLSSRIPKDTSAFYDDAHFNESGARMVAAMLSRYLVMHTQSTAWAGIPGR